MLRDVLSWLCLNQQETVKIDIYPTTVLCSLASLPDELYHFVLTRIFVHSMPSDYLSLLLVNKTWHKIGHRAPLCLKPNKFLPLALRNGFPKIASLDLSGACEVLDERLPCLVALKNLVALKLKRCREITDEGLTHLELLTKLRNLNLGRCCLIRDPGFILLCRKLVHLRRLNVKHCYGLTSHALTELSSLTSLVVFNCSGCQGLRYEALSMIGQVASLRVLKMNHCSAAIRPGIDPLLKLTSLVTLQLKTDDADRRNDSDTLLQSMQSSFRRLQRLYLSMSTSVSSVGFAALISLQYLEVLRLEGQRLVEKGIFHTVAQLPRLAEFQLFDGSYETSTVRPLTSLRMLRSLTVKGREFTRSETGSRLGGLSELTHLRKLVLWNDEALTGWSIEGLEELQQLSLQGCSGLKSENMENFIRLRRLRVLKFCKCLQLDDAFIISLQRLPILERLYIYACPSISGRHFGVLAPLTELSTIVLQFSPGINDNAIKQLTTINSLRRLEVVMCRQVTEDGIRFLLNGDLIHLEYLNISGCLAPRLTTQTFQNKLPKFKKLITGSLDISILK